MNNISLDDIRAHACGNWQSILLGIGVPAKYLNTRQHCPCPSCGGKDRYRFTDFLSNGGFICNQCTADGGSGFDLIMLVYGCEFSEAVKMVANQLGLTSDSPNITHKPIKPKNQQTIAKDDIKRIKGFLWGAQSATSFSPIGRYLVSRGLDWQAINGGLKGVFYRESLDYWTLDSFNRPFKIGAYPAMIAKITKGSELMGVHLTYLEKDRGGKWRKLQITQPATGKPLPAKKMQSRYSGALSGASVQLYRPHDGVLALCEGIETALAVRQMFGLPVWACGSAGMLRNVELPPDLKTLYIVADNDDNNAGRDACRDLSNRAIKAGLTVKHWQPSTIGHDALDELNRQKKDNVK